MKKLFLIALAALFCLQAQAQEKQLSALFSYATFDLPQGQPYVETYLDFDAWNMNFVRNDAGRYQAVVEVVLSVERNDTIVFLKKYDLKSPAIDNADAVDFNFVDVQRFSLPNGIYNLSISLRDKNASAKPSLVTETLAVAYLPDMPAMSSVQMMSKVSKTVNENILSRGGYDMEPYVSDYVPQQVGKINFYYEIYHIDQELGSKPFLAEAYIEQRETGIRVGDMQAAKRLKAAPMVPVYQSIDISQLPSGNYNLVVEARNRDNARMLVKKVPFYRSNPGVEGPEVSLYSASFAARYNDEDTLNFYLDALYPIASGDEIDLANNLIKRPGLDEKQAFLYEFWKRRNALDPEGAWHEYLLRLNYVEKSFSYPKTRGYRTDQGRVYLQYGAPDFVRDEKNFVSVMRMGSGTNAKTRFNGSDNASQGQIFYLPYQLWRYNQLPTDQPNRVFLFWDEHRSGFYRLLQSNARGEVQDPKWERRLCQQQLNEDIVGEVGEQFERGY